MRILCVADHIDPLVYSTQIKARFKNVDLVLGAGDLPLEYYSFIVSSLNVPLLFVFGNHNLNHLAYYQGKDMADAMRRCDDNYFRGMNATGATYMEDRNKKVQNILVAGLGGSGRYNDGEHQFTEWQMYWRIFRMIPRLLWNRLVHGRFLDILLTHAPPRGIHDKKDKCHTGFKAFISFMNWFKPKYLIHGHIHLYELNEVRRTSYKETLVVNCYDHIVLEFENARPFHHQHASVSGLQQGQDKRTFFANHSHSETPEKPAAEF